MSLGSIMISKRSICFIYFLLCYTVCTSNKDLRHLKIKAETLETMEKKAVIIMPETRARQVLLLNTKLLLLWPWLVSSVG